VTVQLTTTSVIQTIYARENRRRTIWTPNILLERAGIARYPNYPAVVRKKAARILKELWRAGKLVRRVDLNRRYVTLEASYMRPEDKSALYFVACENCGFPRLVRYGQTDACRRCAREKIDENLYYAASPGRPQPVYPSYTDPPPRPKSSGRASRRPISRYEQ
jgi:hypothetical protein